MVSDAKYRILPSQDIDLESVSEWRRWERLFSLSDGRTMAYTEGGNPSSDDVLLIFHHMLSVGLVRPMTNIPVSRVLQEKDAHAIAPTLPGWGSSSPTKKSTSFSNLLFQDISELLDHLHPKKQLRLFVVGNGLGTVPAQLLYGAPFHIFPLGRHIVAMQLSLPYSPRHYTNTSAPRPLVGPPKLLAHEAGIDILVSWMVKLILRWKLRNVESAEAMFRSANSRDATTRADLRLVEQWLGDRGIDMEQCVRTCAEIAVYSVSKSWAGFEAVAQVLQAGWEDFDPARLDEEHASRPVLIISSKGRAATQYLGENYKNVKVILYDNYLSESLQRSDEMWQTFFEMAL